MFDDDIEFMADNAAANNLMKSMDMLKKAIPKHNEKDNEAQAKMIADAVAKALADAGVTGAGTGSEQANTQQANTQAMIDDAVAKALADAGVTGSEQAKANDAPFSISLKDEEAKMKKFRAKASTAKAKTDTVTKALEESSPASVPASAAVPVKPPEKLTTGGWIVLLIVLYLVYNWIW